MPDQFTRDDIEARNFSFCSAMYGRGQGIAELRWETFLVPSPFKAEAMEQARRYASERWGDPDELNVYPRNYVRDARLLFLQGRYPR